MRRLFTLALSLTALSSVASAYYHWIYFANGNAPFTPAPAKFDLNALPDGHTVSYLISDQGPGPLMPDDSFQAIISQIRLAASVWNGVTSSDLRLSFGGLSSSATQQSAPGIDVVFDDDMPPGLLAQSRPTTVEDVSFLTNGATFVPIVRSRMQLRRDLTVNQQASYSDAFFMTIVHEFGHTLGLQHSLVSGVMATSPSGARATTKARPLSADDIAGISLLYPASGFASSTGGISGTVLLGKAGVNLASIVAISTSGVVVSGMTNPDGTYRIDGIAPGSYYVYVHPLPPAADGEAYPANIVPPQDVRKSQFLANTGFDTQFYPGTRDWTQATVINVTAGNTVAGINFSVQARNGPAIYDMVTYGYLTGPGGPVPVKAPPLPSGKRTWLVFFAYGTVVNNNQLAPGLNVSVMGGTAQVEAGTLAYWTGGYLIIVVDTGTVSAATPVALAVTVNNDLYVLPAAFTVVPTPGPILTSVVQGADGQGNPIATVSGSNLGLDARVLFDGARADVTNLNSDGSLSVLAPPAPGGYRASVEVLAGDGQTSSQSLGSAEPLSFTYTGPNNPRISMDSPLVTSGTDTMVEIRGFDTNFVSGRTNIGFGSSDIFVRRVWVVGPGRLLANISVSPTAPTVSSVSVVTGLQMVTLPTALQLQAANTGQASLRTPIVNEVTSMVGVPVGGTALINTTGLPQNLGGWILTIGGQQTGFTMGANGQIRAAVPGSLLPGPAVVQLVSPGGPSVPPVLMQVDPPPPAITGAVNTAGVSIDGSHPVKSGDTVTLAVAGLADSNNVLPAASSVRVNIGGINIVAAAVNPGSGTPGACLVQFVVPANLSNGAQQVSVGVDTRVSAVYSIAVQN